MHLASLLLIKFYKIYKRQTENINLNMKIISQIIKIIFNKNDNFF